MSQWRKILFSKPPPAKKGEVNYSFLDRFTLVHFAIGFGYGLLDFSFGFTVFLALAWEMIENPLKFHLSFMFPHGTADTIQNILGDCIAVILGWWVKHYFTLLG